MGVRKSYGLYKPPEEEVAGGAVAITLVDSFTSTANSSIHSFTATWGTLAAGDKLVVFAGSYDTGRSGAATNSSCTADGNTMTSIAANTNFVSFRDTVAQCWEIDGSTIGAATSGVVQVNHDSSHLGGVIAVYVVSGSPGVPVALAAFGTGDTGHSEPDSTSSVWDADATLSAGSAIGCMYISNGGSQYSPASYTTLVQTVAPATFESPVDWLSAAAGELSGGATTIEMDLTCPSYLPEGSWVVVEWPPA